MSKNKCSTLLRELSGENFPSSIVCDVLSDVWGDGSAHVLLLTCIFSPELGEKAKRTYMRRKKEEKPPVKDIVPLDSLNDTCPDRLRRISRNMTADYVDK